MANLLTLNHEVGKRQLSLMKHPEGSVLVLGLL